MDGIRKELLNGKETRFGYLENRSSPGQLTAQHPASSGDCTEGFQCHKLISIHRQIENVTRIERGWEVQRNSTALLLPLTTPC